LRVQLLNEVVAVLNPSHIDIFYIWRRDTPGLPIDDGSSTFGVMHQVKLLAVQHVGPGDDQCAAGDWGEDRARMPYNFVTATPLTLLRSWVVTTSYRPSCGSQVLRPQRRWD
jgi:hypothetical protein